VEQLNLGEIPKCTKLDLMTKEEIMTKYTDLESEYLRALGEIYKLKYQNLTDSQLKLILSEQLSQMRKDKFGASSERYKKPEKKKPEVKEPPKPRVKKPSERYPYIPVREVFIQSDSIPPCNECGKVMRETGMTEDSEQLTVIPKKYEIILQKRAKYACSCQSCIITAAAPPRIIPGSSYSDEMILDVALSKYCDLIPIERYVAMAERNGLFDLPPHSLIELTHQYAEFLKPIYELLKKHVMDARVLCADETPHRMLEGSNKKKWYLWGFSTSIHCFLECHDTRSGDVAGDVASDILVNSKCEVLLSDVYSGYGKAVRISNLKRKEAKNPLIIEQAHCNAHARRYFFRAHEIGNYPESTFYLDHYHEIYQLNDETKGKPPPEILAIREQMITSMQKHFVIF
jgi:transposase